MSVVISLASRPSYTLVKELSPRKSRFLSSMIGSRNKWSKSSELPVPKVNLPPLQELRVSKYPPKKTPKLILVSQISIRSKKERRQLKLS